MELHASPLLVDEPTSSARLDFDRIHEAYRARIHRYLSRLVGPLDAEDVTQLVFVRVSEALPAFRGESSLGTWLYRIARNAALDWRRSAARTEAVHQELAEGVTGPRDSARGEESPSVDEALIHREMQQCLHGVIAELPEAYRNVLALRELDGWHIDAIAEALGVSPATVKIRLHRARGRLRETLTARCDFTRDGLGLGCERKGAA